MEVSAAERSGKLVIEARRIAKRYGISQQGVLEDIPGREVSARSLSRLIEHMRATGVTAIFGDIRKPQQTAAIMSF